jgi:hypothetical protein
VSFLVASRLKVAIFWRLREPVVFGGHMRRREFITLLGGAAVVWPGGYQSKDSQSAWPQHSPNAAFPRRRGDRMMSPRLERIEDRF